MDALLLCTCACIMHALFSRSTFIHSFSFYVDSAVDSGECMHWYMCECGSHSKMTILISLLILLFSLFLVVSLPRSAKMNEKFKYFSNAFFCNLIFIRFGIPFFLPCICLFHECPRRFLNTFACTQCKLRLVMQGIKFKVCVNATSVRLIPVLLYQSFYKTLEVLIVVHV